MVTIKVVRQSTGNPEKGVSVAISFGMLSGQTKTIRTDSNGEAHFDVKPQNGEVFAAGRSRFRGKIEGRVVVYI